MKHLFYIAGMFLLLVMMLTTGCDHAPRYDQRLVQADSLMQSDPDSALAIVVAVNRDSLTNEGDRAYRDLLLTQARYRCYITAINDSDINRALDHYRRHSGEREKLTRAYIYKGAVMDELGHPDSAMYYYKHAEATAAPDDYFNLGYVKMRMGALYSDYYAYDGMGIDKFESALYYFNIINSPDYKHKCLNNLGCLYRESQPRKAEKLLNEALELSRHANDSNGIIADTHALIELYSHNKEYGKAIQLIRCINPLDKSLDVSYFTSAANVYSGLDMPDSADLFLQLAEQEGINSDEERMYYLESLSKVAYARHDTINYMKLQNQSNFISDSLLQHSKKLLISRTEIDFDDNAQHRNALSQQRVKHLIILSSILMIFAIIALLLFHFHRLKGYQHIIKELRNESEEQLRTLDRLKQNIGKLGIGNQPIRDFVNNQLDMLREITIACYQESASHLGKQVKNIVQLSDKNQHYWMGLYDFIDDEYNGIMSITRQRYPHLTNKDLLLIALNTLGFSYIQISMIMGYANPTSIGTLKQRLAKKMDLDCSLNDYISSFSSL